jgi:Mlc titration factor MtfA (ptsG expression regulator)
MTHTLLQQYCPWYQSMSATDQSAFCLRVEALVKGRQIQGRSGVVITEGHKTLIMAAGALVSYHFDKFYYPQFNLIQRRYTESGIHLPGALTLSWEDLSEEYTALTPVFQTAIHEFAHAVYYENRVADEGYTTIDDTLIRQFMNDYAPIVLARWPEKLMELRPYNQQIPQQFFAAATEHFYMQPATLRELASPLYDWLCFVYRHTPNHNH